MFCPSFGESAVVERCQFFEELVKMSGLFGWTDASSRKDNIQSEIRCNFLRIGEFFWHVSVGASADEVCEGNYREQKRGDELTDDVVDIPT